VQGHSRREGLNCAHLADVLALTHAGIVLVKCDCKKLHLIADNLDWFGSGKTNIEDILSSRGDEVRRRGYWTDGRDVFEMGR
jgi:hypothetical protein